MMNPQSKHQMEVGILEPMLELCFIVLMYMKMNVYRFRTVALILMPITDLSMVAESNH